MSCLDDFLNLQDVSEIRETVKERIGGKDFEFVIRPLNQDEHSSFQKRSNTVNGKKITFDLGKYNKLVLESCIIEPNFADEKFLTKAKCTSAFDFISKKLPAGIIMDLTEKIQKLSGFESINADIEEAKN